MTTPRKRFLFWTSRILSLLFAGLLSRFALDVLEENHGFWNTPLAWLLHLIPTAMLLILLAGSWRWEWMGGLAFPALGAGDLVALWGRFHGPACAIIAGCLFLLGGLCLLSWSQRTELQAATRANA
jgi:hypothetical protein